MTLGDSSSARVGDGVIAVGNALALAGAPTVTEGIVSAEGRALTTSDASGSLVEHLSGLLQTDAPINPGNSGGPLLDARGEVIGINTAVATIGKAPAQNVGFAIPINAARPIVARLLAAGREG